MKIAYKKHRVYYYLAFGFLWLIIGLIGYDHQAADNWKNLGFFMVAILYFAIFLHKKINQYLTIKNGAIKKHTFFGRKIRLNEISQIKRTSYGYALISDKKELRIFAEFIDKKSLPDLTQFIDQLGLPDNKLACKNQAL
ncbi:hypothetical protein [Carboxylicivirga taeanensis]|uniref:hypothetical protein n=1 Tax=Carboxylicivirga taeanensis TaxID=1416875 RepID=UPI003F6E07E0